MAEESNTEAAPEPEVVVTVPPDGAAPPVADPAIKDLAEQYKALEEKSKEDQAAREAAMARAAEAEKIAQAARREAHAAREAAASSNLDTITTAQSAAQAALDAAVKARRAAKQAGDEDAEDEAISRQMQAMIDLRTYDEAKANIEARKKAPPPRPSGSGPATETEIVDAYIANRTQPTAEWLRNHKDYILDGRKNAKLTAAHHDAIAEGLQPDTQKYFDHVEKFVGLKKNDDKPVTEGDDVQRPGAVQATKKPTQRSVAPVNGASGTGGAVSNNTVTLSQREATAATDGTHIWNWDDPQKKFKKGDPIGLEEFARRKLKMMQQGLYDKTFENQ